MQARRAHESHIVLDDYRLFGVNESASMSAEARARYAPYPSPQVVRAHVCAGEPRARFLVGLDTMHVSLGAHLGHGVGRRMPLDHLPVA